LGARRGGPGRDDLVHARPLIAEGCFRKRLQRRRSLLMVYLHLRRQVGRRRRPTCHQSPKASFTSSEAMVFGSQTGSQTMSTVASLIPGSASRHIFVSWMSCGPYGQYGVVSVILIATLSTASFSSTP